MILGYTVYVSEYVYVCNCIYTTEKVSNSTKQLHNLIVTASLTLHSNAFKNKIK